MVLIGMDEEEDKSKFGTSPLDEVEVEEVSFGFERDRVVWDGSMQTFEVEESDIDAEEIVEELEREREYNFIGPSNEEKRLTDISGIGHSKATQLIRAGYESVEDIREAAQEELADVCGIGNALAARIKADVGKVEKKCEPVDESSDFLDEGTLMVNME